MGAIDGEKTHPSLLEATSSHIVLLGLLIKLRWVLAVETEDQIEGLFFAIGARHCGIHAHKMLKLQLSFDLRYIAVEESLGKSIEIIKIHRTIVFVPDILFE